MRTFIFFLILKAKRYREMFLKEIGNEIINIIYETSIINNNESLMSLCEELLGVIEKNSETQII